MVGVWNPSEATERHFVEGGRLNSQRENGIPLGRVGEAAPDIHSSTPNPETSGTGNSSFSGLHIEVRSSQLTAEADAKVPPVLSSDHSYLSGVVLFITQVGTSASALIDRISARSVVRADPPASESSGGYSVAEDTRTCRKGCRRFSGEVAECEYTMGAGFRGEG